MWPQSVVQLEQMLFAVHLVSEGSGRLESTEKRGYSTAQLGTQLENGYFDLLYWPAVIAGAWVRSCVLNRSWPEHE